MTLGAGDLHYLKKNTFGFILGNLLFFFLY